MDTTEYRFKWLLQNYANIEKYFPCLQSPKFYAEGLEETSWFLKLYTSKYIIDLERSFFDEGPENIRIKFEITITTGNGSTVFSEKSEYNFGQGDSRSFHALADMAGRRENLVVLCRIWKGTVEKVNRCTVRSCVITEKISFFLKVENFSTRKVNRANTSKAIPSFSKTGCNFLAFLQISERDRESITIVTEYSNYRHLEYRTTLSLIDASGNTTEFAVDENHCEGVDQKDELPKLTRQFLLSNRKKYLPDDELTLMCELIFPRDIHMTEETLHDISIATYLDKYRDA